MSFRRADSLRSATVALFVGTRGLLLAQEPPGVAPAAPSAPKPVTPALVEGESDGKPTILHRDDVLRGRGQNGRHLWPLLSIPEARMNYFEVTGRGALHFHPDADHRLYVLEGTVVVTCGSTVITCGPGDFIIIPKGVRHCYDVPTPGARALLLTFDAPPYDPKKTVNVEPSRTGSKPEEKGPTAEPKPPSPH